VSADPPAGKREKETKYKQVTGGKKGKKVAPELKYQKGGKGNPTVSVFHSRGGEGKKRRTVPLLISCEGAKEKGGRPTQLCLKGRTRCRTNSAPKQKGEGGGRG